MPLLQKPTLSLKTLSVFTSIFVIFSAYLLWSSVGFYSLKISYYHVLAKFYVLTGLENVDMDITGSFGAIFTRKATDVANNLYAIGIYKNTINSILSSVVTSFIWTIFLVAILAFVFIANDWRKSAEKNVISGGLMKNLFIKTKSFGNSLILAIQKQNQSNSVTQNNISVVESKNIHIDKKSKTKSKTYQLIADSNLPYPILKRVVLVESAEK